MRRFQNHQVLLLRKSAQILELFAGQAPAFFGHKIEENAMNLNTVQEIERAIGQLTPRELEELYSWLDQNCPQPIDVQLNVDLEAGRVDDRINRALSDYQAGITQLL